MLKYLVAGAALLLIVAGGAFVAISSSGGEASGEGISFTGYSYNTATQTASWTIRIESKAYAKLALGIKANPGESVVNLTASTPDGTCTPALPQATTASCTMPESGVLTLSASEQFAQRCEASVFPIPTTVVTPPSLTPPLPPMVASGTNSSLDASGKSVTNAIPAKACASKPLGPDLTSPNAPVPAGNTNTGPIKRGRPAN